MIYDFCVVGGGIVGLATALKLLESRPGSRLLLIEKEDRLAAHQTGHNSGVIHSGIYYAPGSFKADLCRRGAEATKAFCTAHDIKFETCGKLLVATDGLENERMMALYQRSMENGIAVELLVKQELIRREPNINGVGALFVPSTGIVDYRKVCEAMADDIRAAGGAIMMGTKVDRIVESGENVSIGSGTQTWQTERLVVCAGLQSDRMARLAGLETDFQIVPFRGEYFTLRPELGNIVSSLIYPIPDPSLPFLGVHLTRMIDGSVTVGPNAVLGFARERYPKLSMDFGDATEFAAFPGFWKLLKHNWRTAIQEMRNSLSKRGYLELCRKYCPSLTLDDLTTSSAGIRAQAVRRNGELIHDFLFLQTGRMVHVCNAPSPAATSAIPIGEMIAQKCLS